MNANTSALFKTSYQHPYVDIFKEMKIGEAEGWSTIEDKKAGPTLVGNCHKEGKEVHGKVWDKTLGKYIVRIHGANSTSNYIQVPASKFLPRKRVLGLTGKYVYLMLKKPDQKNFVIHLDYVVNDSRLAKIQLSNTTKKFKSSDKPSHFEKNKWSSDGVSLQIPMPLPDKWTVVALNVEQILRDNKCIPAELQAPFFLRSFMICANVSCRGVFTSDIPYTIATLPKDMQFKLSDQSEWFSKYAWMAFPPAEMDMQQMVAQQMNITMSDPAITANEKSEVKSEMSGPINISDQRVSMSE